MHPPKWIFLRTDLQMVFLAGVVSHKPQPMCRCRGNVGRETRPMASDEASVPAGMEVLEIFQTPVSSLRGFRVSRNPGLLLEVMVGRETRHCDECSNLFLTNFIYLPQMRR